MGFWRWLGEAFDEFAWILLAALVAAGGYFLIRSAPTGFHDFAHGAGTIGLAASYLLLTVGTIGVLRFARARWMLVTFGAAVAIGVLSINSIARVPDDGVSPTSVAGGESARRVIESAQVRHYSAGAFASGFASTLANDDQLEIDSQSSETREVRAPLATPEDAAKFYDGRVSVAAPRQMGVSQTTEIEVQVGLRSEPTPHALISGARLQSADARITREVDVQLVSNDFDIEQQGRVGTLMVVPGLPARWIFRAHPRSSGPDKKILVNIYGIVRNGPDGSGVSLIRVQQQVISVTVSPIERVGLVSGWLRENWEPLAAVIGALGTVMGFCAAVWRLFWRKRKVIEPLGAGSS